MAFAARSAIRFAGAACPKPLSQAVAFDHTCSEPHAGHLIRESLTGKAVNAASSISIPVETNSPVREHIMVTDATPGFPVFHPVCGTKDHPGFPPPAPERFGDYPRYLDALDRKVIVPGMLIGPSEALADLVEHPAFLAGGKARPPPPPIGIRWRRKADQQKKDADGSAKQRSTSSLGEGPAIATGVLPGGF